MKTPVVFLPGLLCDSQLWQPQVAGLGPSIAPWVADLTRDDSIAGMALLMSPASIEREKSCCCFVTQRIAPPSGRLGLGNGIHGHVRA